VPAIPWYAAAILVVIAGSVGVMISRTPLVPALRIVAPPAASPGTEGQAAPEAPTDPTLASEPEASVPPLPALVEETGPVAAPHEEMPAPVTAPEPSPPAPVTPTAPTKAARAQAASPAPKKTAGQEPDRLVPEPMKTFVPVTRVVTVVETLGVAPAAPKRIAPRKPPILKQSSPELIEPDPLTAAAEDLTLRVQVARHATAHADEDPTAANYEAAAEKWEAIVSDLRGQPAQPRARYQLAAARFHAWEVHPNAQRAASAVAALRLCLVFTGPGAERDSAKAWLARLGH
jgi:hypothetical protein